MHKRLWTFSSNLYCFSLQAVVGSNWVHLLKYCTVVKIGSVVWYLTVCSLVYNEPLISTQGVGHVAPPCCYRSSDRTNCKERETFHCRRETRRVQLVASSTSPLFIPGLFMAGRTQTDVWSYNPDFSWLTVQSITLPSIINNNNNDDQ